MKLHIILAILIVILSTGFVHGQRRGTTRPTVAEAQKFIADAERRISELTLRNERIAWINQTYISEDTDKLSADALTDMTAAITELAKASRRFKGIKLPSDTAR